MSDSTEKNDRTVKMELYKAVEVSEYWIVDWRKRQVEIYVLVPDETSMDNMKYELREIVNEKNKDCLEIKTFPRVKILFDDLFDGVE